MIKTLPKMPFFLHRAQHLRSNIGTLSALYEIDSPQGRSKSYSVSYTLQMQN